jgi:hypothetical protein
VRAGRARSKSRLGGGLSKLNSAQRSRSTFVLGEPELGRDAPPSQTEAWHGDAAIDEPDAYRGNRPDIP